MSFRTLRLTFFYGLAACLLFVGESYAQRAPRGAEQLQNGMSPAEVVSLIGAPVSRQELEAKREQIWSYAGLELKFFEGRLVLPTVQGVNIPEESLPVRNVMPRASRGNPGTQLMDILSEISKSGSTGSPDSPNSPFPGNFPLGNQPSPAGSTNNPTFPLNIGPGGIQPIQP